MMIGGFFDAHHASWEPHDRALFAALLTETDVDIMAWAIGTEQVPERYQGQMMNAFQRLDFIKVTK
jgi:antitoxin CptB